MGARSNIVVQESNGNRIYLYGHWMGEDSINVVAEVLSQRERWGDESYLARMLFAKMIEGDPQGSTGYGISTYMCDNEYPLIVLEPATMTAVLEEYDWNTKSFTPITPRVSFEEFLKACVFSESFVEMLSMIGKKLVVNI